MKEYNSGMPAIIEDGGWQYKVFIDFEDREIIALDRYDWCDVYAKFNMAFGDAERYPKLMAIDPAFGITQDCKAKVLVDFLVNYVKARGHTAISAKLYLRDYLYSFVRRRRIEVYETPATIKPNYIFHASTLCSRRCYW